jgi:hypothetical protein
VVNITTPWGKFFSFSSDVGGKRCIVVTEDVGITAGKFGEMFAGEQLSRAFSML